MNYRESVFVDSKTIADIEECYIYGTGIDAEDLINKAGGDIHIRGFVDNKRAGGVFNRKRIVSFNQFIKQSKGSLIVIATYRYGLQIAKDFQSRGFMPEKDFYIWDDQFIFHKDYNTEQFIEFNNDLWKDNKKYIEADGVILIPFDNKHTTAEIVPVAYCANYFAEKYNARIEGYFRFGAEYDNASSAFLDIYKSFNMSRLVPYGEDYVDRDKVDILTEQIWGKLHSWEDWKNITIFGIEFGTTIIRHLLRVHVLSFEATDDALKPFLREAIMNIVFWYDYFEKNNVRVVLLADGVSWEGYIREIAIHKGIPAYIVDYFFAKTFKNYNTGAAYPYYSKFWNELSETEKEKGVAWAKKELDKRVKGQHERISTSLDRNVYASKYLGKVLESNNKTKLMICPHIFEEDCYWCGEQIFDNNYLSWLNHLGELSNKFNKYDWYIKMHPSASKRDYIYIENFLSKYENIKKIDAMISPIQLQKEGMRYALTVCGSIAYEYPLIGIDVINGGKNPGSSFRFAWNPKTKEEYDYLIANLDTLEKRNIEDAYKYYCLEFMYYRRIYMNANEVFFQNKELGLERMELLAKGKERGSWMYGDYMSEWTKERHEKIMRELPNLFSQVDKWEASVFYRKI